MSLSNILLFITTSSTKCVPCIQFIRANQLQDTITVVRLDTQEARDKVSNGKYFKIYSVPSMVVVYRDGNTQVFIGVDKIMQWLIMFMNSKTQNIQRRNLDPKSNPMTIVDEDESTEEEFIPQPKRIVIEDDDEDDNYEDNYVEELPPPKPKIAKANAKAKAKPKSILKAVDNEENIEIGLTETKSKKKGKQVSKKKKVNLDKETKLDIEPDIPKKIVKSDSRMKNIYQMASQMEKDRTNSLGYKEEELPHYL